MADWLTTMSVVRPPAARYELRCWGEFALVDGAGRDLSPRGRKARAIIAWLAAHPDMPVSRERLASLLWSDRGEEQARASLRQCLHELRDLADGATPLLRVTRDHVTLDSAALVDGCDRNAALRGADELDALAAAIAAGEGVLFRDLDDLSEDFDEWLRVERQRRRVQLIASALDAVEAGLARGDTTGARALAGALEALDPLDETVARAAMTADAYASDVAALERRFQRLRDMLARELGVEPSRETQSLHQDLRRRLGREAPPVEEEPVPALAIAEPLPAAPAPKSRRRHLTSALAAAGLAVMLLAAALFWLAPNPFRQSDAAPASLAVLPFRNLSPGDDYFADGMAEEIMTQLAREPRLRIAGRTSSWQFKDETVDLKQVGRKLDVAYILEGSVRSAGDKVRVNVALVQASDGMQLWAETFDGTLDDVLAIQRRIGANVAGTLKRKLVQARPLTGTLATSGAVYSLYLTARGLIRERNPDAKMAAKEKLISALALDPNFAPAWSSLAQIEQFEGQGLDPEARVKRGEAVAHARKALALAPDLAEAHGVLGMILGFEHPVGQRHVKRAAALDPNSAEFQFWLGHVYGNEADFPRMLAAYRRAFAIDPLWGHAQYYVVEAAWQMGYPDEALGYVRRVESDGSRYQAHLIRAALAWVRGDFSEEARENAAARAATNDPGKKAMADWNQGFVFRRLTLFDAARRVWERLEPDKHPPSGGADPYVAIRQGKPPTREELRIRNRNIPYFFEDNAYAAIAAKLLINAGRARDVVALYDSDEGIMSISHRRLPGRPARYFEDGPLVAAALRAVGRGAEAERILAHLDRAIGLALRRSRGGAPPWFLAAAAQTWTLRGKHEAALSALERARQNGWAYVGSLDDSSLRDIGDEPAFRSLRGHPRFETIRSRLDAHLDRERRELGAMRL